MTQRWQRELERLGSLRAPERIRERYEDPGARGSPDAAPRQRVLAGVVALSVFAAAGLFAWRVLQPDATGTGGEDTPREVSDVLRVRCNGETAEVLTPVVGAQPHGVHVHPVGFPDAMTLVIRPVGFKLSWFVSGSKASRTHEIPTGEVRLACDRSPVHMAELAFSQQATATVVDPDDVFVSYELECPPEEHVGLDIDRGGRRSEASLVDAVTQEISGLRADDQVQPAGYLRGRAPWLFARLVRDGRVIAWFIIDGRHGWKYRVMHAFACSSEGIGEPTSDKDDGVGFG